MSNNNLYLTTLAATHLAIRLISNLLQPNSRGILYIIISLILRGPGFNRSERLLTNILTTMHIPEVNSESCHVAGIKYLKYLSTYTYTELWAHMLKCGCVFCTLMVGKAKYCGRTRLRVRGQAPRVVVVIQEGVASVLFSSVRVTSCEAL